jgi:hypothetical protein
VFDIHYSEEYIFFRPPLAEFSLIRKNNLSAPTQTKNTELYFLLGVNDYRMDAG